MHSSYRRAHQITQCIHPIPRSHRSPKSIASTKQQIFRTYDELDKDLKTQVIEATPLCYIDALSHDTLGFANVTCLDLLTHLWSTYGTITQAELDENEVRMKTPWSPPTPVETLFTQLTKARAFATAGGDQHNDIIYVRAWYNIM